VREEERERMRERKRERERESFCSLLISILTFQTCASDAFSGIRASDALSGTRQASHTFLQDFFSYGFFFGPSWRHGKSGGRCSSISDKLAKGTGWRCRSIGDKHVKGDRKRGGERECAFFCIFRDAIFEITCQRACNAERKIQILFAACRRTRRSESAQTAEMIEHEQQRRVGRRVTQ
jgi:hypothetical protein